MAKRYRRRNTKPGQLQAYYGKLPHDEPDLILANGEGVPRCDRAYLYVVFGSDRYGYKGIRGDKELSFFEELKARGYDMDTFRFSIQKKVDQQAER